MPCLDPLPRRLVHPRRRAAAPRRKTLAGLALSTLVALAQGAAPAPACQVHSDRRTAALVELYTSEGCSSCPPADRRLRELPALLDADALAVPAAWHVDYWDDIGWRDPYADRAHAERQRLQVQANGHRTLVTPHFFVSGRELRDGAAGLREAVRAVNARPSPVDIALVLTPTTPTPPATPGRDALGVQATATWRATAGGPEGSALHLVLTESGLSSEVLRGENRGVTLHHDHVVRAWRPAQPLAQGTAVVQHRWLLPAGWRRDQLAVLAFVQGASPGAVLQAVRLPLAGCTP